MKIAFSRTYETTEKVVYDIPEGMSVEEAPDHFYDIADEELDKQFLERLRHSAYGFKLTGGDTEINILE